MPSDGSMSLAFSTSADLSIYTFDGEALQCAQSQSEVPYLHFASVDSCALLLVDNADFTLLNL